MTHYRDLALCRYGDDALNADAWRAPLLAIGWLGFPFPYRLGRVPPGFRSRLDALVGGAERHSYGSHYWGFHICSWCVVTLRIPPEQPWSQSSLWVPGNGVVYVAPIGIPHYVAAHWYRPPTEFIEAVMRCPEYGSIAYEAVLKEANGGVVPPLLVGRWAAVVRESAGRVSSEECQSAWLAIKEHAPHHFTFIIDLNGGLTVVAGSAAFRQIECNPTGALILDGHGVRACTVNVYQGDLAAELTLLKRCRSHRVLSPR